MGTFLLTFSTVPRSINKSSIDETRPSFLVAQLVRFGRLVSKSKVPRLAARLRPGYLVRWQAGNAQIELVQERRGTTLPLPTQPRTETQQLINARSRNAISAWPASPTLWTRDRRASSRFSSSRAILGRGRTRTCIFSSSFFFQIMFPASKRLIDKIDILWAEIGERGEVRSNLTFYRCCSIFHDTLHVKFRAAGGGSPAFA